MFIAWYRNRPADRDFIGSSFATGATLESCRQQSAGRLPEMLRRSNGRGFPIATVTITAGARQTIVEQRELSTSADPCAVKTGWHIA